MNLALIYTRLVPWTICLFLALLIYSDVWWVGEPYEVDARGFFESLQDQASFLHPLTYSIWLGVFKAIGWANGALFFQAYIALMLIWLAMHYYVRARYRLGLLIAFGLLLYFATGFPFIINMMSPDAFTGIALLSFVLLIAPSPGKGPFDRIVVTLVFLWSGSMQHGHAFLFLVLMIILSVWAISSSREIIAVKYLGLGWGLVLAVMIVLPSLHAMLGQGFRSSGASHVYLAGRMAENNIMSKYLELHCDKKELALCKYREMLPMSSATFRNSPESPFHREGGFDNEDTRREYLHVFRTSFLHPALLWMHFKVFVGDGIMQIFSFTPEWVKSEGYGDVFRSIIFIRWLLERLFVLLAVVVISVWMLNKNPYLSKVGLFTSLMVCGLIGNAFIEAYLNGVDGTLQAKVMWLLPVTSLILVMAFLSPPIAHDNKNT